MNHSRLFAILLFIFFAAFQSHPAQAQIQKYYYKDLHSVLIDCGRIYTCPTCIYRERQRFPPTYGYANRHCV